MPDYNRYTTEDFLDDKFFIEWVKDKTEKSEQFWLQWVGTQPANLHSFEEAERQLKIILSAKRIEAKKGEDSLLFNKILTSIADTDNKVIRGKWGIRRWMVAASVAALLIVTAGLWFVSFHKSSTTKLLADYGEMKKIVLPDGSEIVLNAHSTIQYEKNWQTGKVREVWLEGEAFFNVHHINKDSGNIQPHERFFVHTKDIDVEVLGTCFDIRQRRGRTEVVLQTGKVKVKFKHSGYPDMVMQPGDFVTYNPNEKQLLLATTVAANYVAWKEKKLILNNPTVNQIIEYLEDNYGKKIVLQDGKMGTDTIEGPVQLNNLDDVLFILSTALNARVIKKDSTLIIRPVIPRAR